MKAPSEQEFQNELMLALSRSGRVRVWRQPAGTIPAARGGMVKAAPMGAADLCGLELGTGRLVQIECKGLRTPVSEQQLQWLAKVRQWGGVAVLVRLARGETAETAAARACAEVLAAIDARCTEVAL